MQPHLLELSRPAGGLPAGALLLGVGLMDLPLSVSHLQTYQSIDGGVTWSYRSTIATGGGGPSMSGVWEPHLVQLDDGRIVTYYADETDPTAQQQLVVHKVSSDGGLTWGPRAIDWQGPHPKDRPGMPAVARMGNGRYIMSVEMCGVWGSDHIGDQCQVRVKTSSDGLTWGAGPTDLGVKTLAALSGHGIRSSPFIAWTPGGGPNGQVIVAGRHHARSEWDGAPTGTDRQTLFVNYNYGQGPWHELIAPVRWDDGGGAAYQAGYRSAMLPSASGNEILYFTATYAGTGTPDRRNKIIHSTANAGVLPYNAPWGTGHDPGWLPLNGTWSVTNGAYTNTNGGLGDKSVAGSTGWTNYVLEADVLVTEAGNAGVLVRVNNPDRGIDALNGYFVGITTVEGGVFVGRQQYNWRPLGTVRTLPGGIALNQWYHLKVEVRGCTINFSAKRVGDPDPGLFTETDPGCVLTSGQVGVRTFDTPASWRNLTVRQLP